MRLTATCPAGLEPALEEEWRTLGVHELKSAPGSVSTPFSTKLLYAAHEQLRSASRLLLELAQGPASDAKELYAFIHSLEWETHFPAHKSLAVRATGSNRELRHTRFIAQQTKDAIVDRLRDKHGKRPNVDLNTPDLRAFVHVHAEQAWAGIDLSGEGLHRRGYRHTHALAPLRENLAAGLLILCDWPARLREDALLLDPMCGSGTLIIEALLYAAGIAPGACRRAAGHASGFESWLGYDEAAHRKALAPGDLSHRGKALIVARDLSADATSSVEQTLRVLRSRHDLGSAEVRVEQLDFFSSPAPSGPAHALLVTNPPYGERLGGHIDEAKPLYRRIGDTLKEHYADWDAWLLCGNKQLAKAVGLRAQSSHDVLHGGIDTRFCHFPIRGRTTQTSSTNNPRAEHPKKRDAEGQMFENRLRKTAKKRFKTAKRQDTTAFRIYDRDIPEFNFSVDWYAGHARVEERERPRNIAEHDADRRRRVALEVVREVLALSIDDVTFRVRSREQGQQDQRADADDVTRVKEGGMYFEVNLKRYLDTGLFLDGALLRKWIRQHARDKTFLNLFSYTCAASIAAAIGGARACTNVDLSNTALEWGQRNATLNNCRKQLRFVHHDVVPWLEQSNARFDIVYAGIPSYSVSRQAREPFDAVRGQQTWLPLMMEQVAEGGCLLLSTHARDFCPNAKLQQDYAWEERSEQFVAEGFRKSPLSQKVFFVHHRS